MEKLRQAHAKEKKEALAEFRSFKRSAKAREESIQARPVHVFPPPMSKHIVGDCRPLRHR